MKDRRTLTHGWICKVDSDLAERVRSIVVAAIPADTP